MTDSKRCYCFRFGLFWLPFLHGQRRWEGVQGEGGMLNKRLGHSPHCAPSFLFSHDDWTTTLIQLPAIGHKWFAWAPHTQFCGWKSLGFSRKYLLYWVERTARKCLTGVSISVSLLPLFTHALKNCTPGGTQNSTEISQMEVKSSRVESI